MRAVFKDRRFRRRHAIFTERITKEAVIEPRRHVQDMEYEEGIDTGARIRLKVESQDGKLVFSINVGRARISYLSIITCITTCEIPYIPAIAKHKTFELTLVPSGVELLLCIAPGDVPYGDEKSNLVANDWHAMLLMCIWGAGFATFTAGTNLLDRVSSFTIWRTGCRGPQVE